MGYFGGMDEILSLKVKPGLAVVAGEQLSFCLVIKLLWINRSYFKLMVLW